jgi:lysyl-tRNA synthetase class 2
MRFGRVFRNEGMDTRHNPEFTLMEFYQAYTDYHGMMDLIEDLIRTVSTKVKGSSKITYDGVELDFGSPFCRMTMVEAVKKYSGVDFNEIKTLDEARAVAKEHNLAYEERHKKGDILNLFFDEYCEEKLIQPTFITEHPVEISPLAKRKEDDPNYTQRFELFVMGRELANAFSELMTRSISASALRHRLPRKPPGDDEACDVDEDFLTALEYGMPPTGGLGIGSIAWSCFLTDQPSIRDVLLFPTLKPLEN